MFIRRLMPAALAAALALATPSVLAHNTVVVPEGGWGDEVKTVTAEDQKALVMKIQALLAEQKEYADPVRAFWTEHKDQFAWDMLPFRFLYDMFVSWSAMFNPHGKPVSRVTFVDDMVQLVEASPAWRATDKEKQTRPAGRMDGPEPLIAEYGLKKWMNPMALGSNDVNKVCLPTLSTNYRGALLRVSAGSHLGLVSDQDEDAEESVVP